MLTFFSLIWLLSILTCLLKDFHQFEFKLLMFFRNTCQVLLYKFLTGYNLESSHSGSCNSCLYIVEYSWYNSQRVVNFRASNIKGQIACRQRKHHQELPIDMWLIWVIVLPPAKSHFKPCTYVVHLNTWCIKLFFSETDFFLILGCQCWFQKSTDQPSTDAVFHWEHLWLI